MKLYRSADLSEFVKPVALPEAEDTFEDANCLISGWGSLFGIGTELPNNLQKLEVNVLHGDICVAPGYGKNHLCVRPRVDNISHSACTGDSG